MSKDLKLKVELGSIGSKIKSIGKNVANTALFTVSNKLKKAFKTELELRKGLKLVINQYNLKNDISIDFEVHEPPLEFAYCVSGIANSSIKTIENKNIELEFRKTSCIMFYFPDSSGKIEIFSNEPLKILSLHIAPDFLDDFIDDQFKHYPNDFIDLLKNKKRETFYKNDIISSEMYDIINEILNCNYEGLTKKMFLEGKALELMTRHISLLSNDNKKNEFKIRNDEKVIIERTKSMIDNNIANPPSLFEIAKKAGMNHSKLNYGFKNIYENTVFGYIRNKRLELSKEMLRNSDQSVSEIAYELGFSSPSHFTREFSRAFEVSPKQYRKSKV